MIHGAFSPATLTPGRWLPDPKFRIRVSYIHRAKHGRWVGWAMRPVAWAQGRVSDEVRACTAGRCS
jgi:hypothetical protein